MNGWELKTYAEEHLCNLNRCQCRSCYTRWDSKKNKKKNRGAVGTMEVTSNPETDRENDL